MTGGIGNMKPERMLKVNFEIALAMALCYLKNEESEKSGYAQGIRNILTASRAGKEIVIKEK